MGAATLCFTHPTEEEIENCRWIVLTSDLPNDVSVADQEESVQARTQGVADMKSETDDQLAFRVLPDPAELMDEDELAARLISAVNISASEPFGGVLGGHGDTPEAPDLSREASAATRERSPERGRRGQS